MAKLIAYGEHYPNCEIMVMQPDGEVITAQGYESAYFNAVPKGKHDYFVRHSDDDICQPSSVKRGFGCTVNFWGTIVTDIPIDFGNMSELKVVDYNYI